MEEVDYLWKKWTIKEELSGLLWKKWTIKEEIKWTIVEEVDY